MKKQNLINYLVKKKLKLADLKLLIYLSKRKKPVKTWKMEKEAKIHYYVVRESIPKLKKLDLVFEKDNHFALKTSNPTIKRLFK